MKWENDDKMRVKVAKCSLKLTYYCSIIHA